jgi:P-type Ca2+ transporter type 2C
LSLAVEPGQRDVMRRPPRDPEHAILSARFIRAIAVYGAMITVATLAAFLWVLRRDGADVMVATTVAFMTLALAQTFHLGNARDIEPVLAWSRVIGNRWALAAVAVTVSLQLVALYFEPLAGILGVVPLGRSEWMVVIPCALFPAVAGQLMAWLKTRTRGAATGWPERQGE